MGATKRKRTTSPPPAPPAPAPAMPARLKPWQVAVAGAVILLGAAAVRIYAALDSPWFDEIWSLMSFALVAKSPLEILSRAHDNNHMLVTLWMYLCGSQEAWIVYRLPSIVAGTLSVLLAGWIARQWGAVGALAAMLLFGGSFMLITYASEARGYALAGFFALLGIVLLQRFLSRPSLAPAVGFWAVVGLGLWSHLTFLFFYAGALAWSVLVLWKTSPNTRRFWVDTATLHGVPLTIFAAFYWFIVRNLAIGGGPIHSVYTTLVESLALAGGGTGTAGLDLAFGLVILGLAGFGLVALWREKSELWALFAVGGFMAPLGMLILRRPEQLYPRYFYIPIVLLLLLVAYAIARLARHSAAGRAVAAGLILLFLGANAWRTYDFLQFGRGQYLAALEFMAENRTDPTITLQSDHDFESQIQLSYFVHRLPNTPITYQPQGTYADRRPEWTVVYGQAQPFTPYPEITDGQNRRYTLVRVFPYTGLSGYHWALYRRVSAK